MNHPVTFMVGALRVICAPSATDVVYAGVAIDAGTRHEHPSESGMAHLVEHMTFKGTARRTSLQILNRMESVGADLNAFTGKEETVFYSVFLKEHLARAIDLLLDLVFHSTYPQAELAKEVEVVCDEIESYNDSPAELIYDDFEALLFPRHPLGRNILGDAERLRQYESSHLQAFTSRLYHPQRAVLFVRGNVLPEQVGKLVEKGLAAMPTDGQPSVPPMDAPSAVSLGLAAPVVVQRPLHQAHVMLGTQAFPFAHPRHMPLALLGNILAGPGLNSRLALALRERRGLVYTVESALTTYSDTGTWSVYFGCDPADVKRCLRLVQTELSRLLDKPLSERSLAAAKRQMKGQLGISYDNFENVAIGMAKRYLHDGIVVSPSDLMAQIDAITALDLHQTATEVLAPDRLTALIYMPS